MSMEKNIATRPTLSVTKTLTIRFSEVDAMGIVWHGSYRGCTRGVWRKI